MTRAEGKLFCEGGRIACYLVLIYAVLQAVT
jgi:hypothetical protein